MFPTLNLLINFKIGRKCWMAVCGIATYVKVWLKIIYGAWYAIIFSTSDSPIWVKNIVHKNRCHHSNSHTFTQVVHSCTSSRSVYCEHRMASWDILSILLNKGLTSLHSSQYYCDQNRSIAAVAIIITPAAQCGPGLFRCNNGRCIRSSFRCNGRSERFGCFDGSDERGCRKLSCQKNSNSLDLGS